MLFSHPYLSSSAFVPSQPIPQARWNADKKLLDDALPKVLFSDAPVVWCKPSASADVVDFPKYTCPVYKTSERRGMLSTTGHSTNFVIDVRLPVPALGGGELDHRHWCKRGVAMLTACD